MKNLNWKILATSLLTIACSHAQTYDTEIEFKYPKGEPKLICSDSTGKFAVYFDRSSKGKFTNLSVQDEASLIPSELIDGTVEQTSADVVEFETQSQLVINTSTGSTSEAHYKWTLNTEEKTLGQYSFKSTKSYVLTCEAPQ